MSDAPELWDDVIGFVQEGYQRDAEILRQAEVIKRSDENRRLNQTNQQKGAKVMSKSFFIEEAKITQSKCKMAIVGPAGVGKTYTALRVAKGIGENVLVIDTENKSSAKYANLFNFKLINMTEYSLKAYIEVLEYASKQDFDVVIIDSLSHAWAGKGGALEQADASSGKFGGNKFAGWKVVTPLQNQLVDTLLAFPSHLIATMRMKTDYTLVNGKPQKVGLGIVQRDSLEYEFDIIGQMDIEHTLSITKTRCVELDGYTENKPGEELGLAVKAWLSEGEPSPIFPEGWYPSKVDFFNRVESKFGFDHKAKTTADILVEAGYKNGYKKENVGGMWKAFEKEYTRLNNEFSQDQHRTDFLSYQIEVEIDKAYAKQVLSDCNGDYQAALRRLTEEFDGDDSRDDQVPKEKM